MKLRTEIEAPDFGFKLNYSDKIFTIGSCFAENIADYLNDRKIKILSNPFGVLYNPISIENAFKLLIGKIELEESDLIYNQHEWHSFYHHSDFSSHIKENLISKIKQTNLEALNFLKESELLTITLGTSFIYKFFETKKVVSNCHKIPQKEFEKRRMTIEEIIKSLNTTIEIIREKNSGIKIVFTVSPVRHWKDGAVENQRSKALLILAIEQILKFNTNVYYFPSYEIMIDDLRDYRFYKNDLLHPNELGVEYIANKFIESVFNEETKIYMKEAFAITNARNHKVRNKKSEAYKKFLQSQIKIIDELEKKYKTSNFKNDQLFFKSELDSFK